MDNCKDDKIKVLAFKFPWHNRCDTPRLDLITTLLLITDKIVSLAGDLKAFPSLSSKTRIMAISKLVENPKSGIETISQ